MCTLMDIEAAWRARCADLRVGTAPGGHWFPEQAAPETAQALLSFFEGQGR
jgi:surfactin synthase thioesterase subunit